jgi:hypothetical protein
MAVQPVGQHDGHHDEQRQAEHRVGAAQPFQRPQRRAVR